MYEVEKVSKHTFGLLVEYLHEGSTNTTTFQRIYQDAISRIQQYKSWRDDHVNLLQSSQENNEEGPNKEDEKESKVQQDDNNDEDDNNQNDDNNNGVDTQERFQNLTYHEKRKEYKRARKIVELCHTKLQL